MERQNSTILSFLWSAHTSACGLPAVGLSLQPPWTSSGCRSGTRVLVRAMGQCNPESLHSSEDLAWG